MALKDGLGGGTGIANINHEINVDTVLTGNTRLFFRDAGLSIFSNADGKVTVESDGSADDAIKMDGPTTVLAGEKAGAEGLTVKDSDEFPMSKLNSTGDLRTNGKVRRIS